MEVGIPFIEKFLSGLDSTDLLKYRAILSRDSLFYGVVKGENELVEYDQVSIDQCSLNHTTPSQEWEDKYLAFNNSLYTLIASEHFDIRKSHEYIQFTNHIIDGEAYKYYSDYIDILGLWIVYAVPSEIIRLLNQYLGSFQCCHYQYSLLTSTSIAPDEFTMDLSRVGNFLHVLLRQNGKLLLSNAYPCYNQSEFYYFIALVFDQFGLRKGEVSIMLDGDIDRLHIIRERFTDLFGIAPLYRSQSGYSQKYETSCFYHPLLEVNRCASYQEA